MPRQPNRKLIGLFLIAGAAGFLLIVGFLLQNKIFGNKGSEVVMYFEESITGLNVGSPVVLKGVKIGEVSRINIIVNPEEMNFSIPVYARMQNKKITAMNHLKGQEVLDELVGRGLRARLVAQSYVTGQLMIELEMLPDTPIKYHDGAKAIEIPTALSPIGELSRGLQKLPLQEGVRNFAEFFKGLNQSMPKINKLLNDVSNVVSQNKSASSEVLDNFNKATINISRAAKSVQNLTDYLERHPEALLRGKK